MNNVNIKAFTLVELIVVITILAILGTIAFISLQGYSANARDSVRISNLTNMDKGLSIIQVKDGVLPNPEGNLTTITSSGSTLMTQGELTQTMAERLLKMSGDITDPVDSTNPIYSVTDDNKYFQVALFLEAGNLASSNITHPNLPFTREGITQKAHAADGKTILTKGSELGIILTADETPVNQQSTHATTVELTTTTDYVAYLNENEKIEASGTELAEKIELAIAKSSARSGSCKDILDRGEGSTDGEYTIYPNGEGLQVYCDMTTDGGGWTLVGENKNGTGLDTRSAVGAVSLSPADKDNWKLSDAIINRIKNQTVELVNGFRITYDEAINRYFWVSLCDFNSAAVVNGGNCGDWSVYYDQVQMYQSYGNVNEWKGLIRRIPSWGNTGWLGSSQHLYPCYTLAITNNECTHWHSGEQGIIYNPGINLWVK